MALHALITRRTIRQYVPNFKIEKPVLKAIIDAALLSPTAHDIQDIDLVAITNKKVIDEISKVTLNTIDEDGRTKFLKRKKFFNIENVITGDASALVCLVKNERATNPMWTNIHEGIIQMALMIGAREFGLQSMALGCTKKADKETIEKIIKVDKGSFLMGVVLGKPIENPFFIERKSLCKARYIE